MSNVAQAVAELRSLAEASVPTDANSQAVPLYWQDEDNILPDQPAPFIFSEVITDPARFIEFGGGRGANRYRNEGELHGYVMFPKGQGLQVGLAIGEQFAAIYRSHKGTHIRAQAASVHPLGEGAALVPDGLSSVAAAYACVVVNVPFYYDQIS